LLSRIYSIFSVNIRCKKNQTYCLLPAGFDIPQARNKRVKELIRKRYLVSIWSPTRGISTEETANAPRKEPSRSNP
jgi:hypothetical protein